jgi:hypothetical protein
MSKSSVEDGDTNITRDVDKQRRKHEDDHELITLQSRERKTRVEVPRCTLISVIDVFFRRVNGLTLR